MRSIVGNDARSQMRLPQRHAEPIVPAGAQTLDKMIPFVDIRKSPPLPRLFPVILQLSGLHAIWRKLCASSRETVAGWTLNRRTASAAVLRAFLPSIATAFNGRSSSR